MVARRNWTYEETKAAFAYYMMMPTSAFVASNEDLRRLAHAVERTPDSIKFKLWNIAACDENRIAKGKKGLSNASKLDRQVWADFRERGDAFLQECMAQLNAYIGSVTGFMDTDESLEFAVVEVPEGHDRQVITTQRVGQRYFHNSLMANYEGKCCITGLAITTLLVASHIKPWKDSDPKTERLAASNGLLLNALHDAAFDKGLITIDKQYRIRVSSQVATGDSHDERNDQALKEYLWHFNGRQITAPKCNPPAPQFIEWHNDKVFKG